jgi:phosphoglycolate phosphatase-like HAD superfamily hydrolase
VSDKSLESFRKSHDYLVGIDSDGCAFDTMEVKHKECFIPNIIKHFNLQPVSKYAREAAEFVNLYSKWRGINRFPALLRTMDLLQERPEVSARGVNVTQLKVLREWVGRETKLGNPALKAEAAKTGDAELALALAWSTAVNESVDDLVHGVPPFPFVRESLEQLGSVADMIVCSATPGAALVKEWQEHDIAKHVAAICGQEAGTKAETLGRAAAQGYAADRVLMIGDAPGDMQAARKVGALFYPINPGAEDASWERFFMEGCDKFLSGQFAGAYEQSLIDEFDAYLPETPPWKR